MESPPEEPRAPLTVRDYVAAWLRERSARGLGCARDDVARMVHALPSLGALLVTEVRPRHLRELVRQLVHDGELAPRTVHHVYGLLHVLFHDAQVDEIITANPCVLKRGDLPKKVDRDPLWRSGAVFTHVEVEALISDERIPDERRTLYAILALAGVRFGEAAALRWSSYDAGVAPLGRILVAQAFNSKTREKGPVKSEVPRQVPTHIVLAEILADWWRSGWALLVGRPPQRDDLVIPSRRGAHRIGTMALRRFHTDCDRLLLRRRRLHDLRRTFVSLTLADGARENVLEAVSHGPRGDIMGLYNTISWVRLCEAVACLRIVLRR